LRRLIGNPSGDAVARAFTRRSQKYERPVRVNSYRNASDHSKGIARGHFAEGRGRSVTIAGTSAAGSKVFGGAA
jgi:hypothetical protein